MCHVLIIYQERMNRINFFPIDENLPKDENSGKTGDNNTAKIPVLNTYGIIGPTFLMPPQ